MAASCNIDCSGKQSVQNVQCGSGPCDVGCIGVAVVPRRRVRQLVRVRCHVHRQQSCADSIILQLARVPQRTRLHVGARALPRLPRNGASLHACDDIVDSSILRRGCAAVGRGRRLATDRPGRGEVRRGRLDLLPGESKRRAHRRELALRRSRTWSSSSRTPRARCTRRRRSRVNSTAAQIGLGELRERLRRGRAGGGVGGVGRADYPIAGRAVGKHGVRALHLNEQRAADRT